LSARQVAAFESSPWAGDAVALRRWDDEALRGEGKVADPRRLSSALARAWQA
jgi:predicted HD phosphohydrolase